MGGSYKNKELNEIKIFFNNKIAYFNKKIIASNIIRSIDKKTSKMLSILVHQSEKQKMSKP